MLAVFATLIVLVAMWLSAIIVAATLEESGFKILATLKGRSIMASAAVDAPIKLRVSERYPAQRPIRVEAGLRAAA